MDKASGASGASINLEAAIGAANGIIDGANVEEDHCAAAEIDGLHTDAEEGVHQTVEDDEADQVAGGSDELAGAPDHEAADAS